MPFTWRSISPAQGLLRRDCRPLARTPRSQQSLSGRKYHHLRPLLRAHCGDAQHAFLVSTNWSHMRPLLRSLFFAPRYVSPENAPGPPPALGAWPGGQA